jgi:hypothetical protein
MVPSPDQGVSMLKALWNQGPVAICLAAIGLPSLTAVIGAAAFEASALKPWYGAVLGGFIGLCWSVGLASELRADRHEA